MEFSSSVGSKPYIPDWNSRVSTLHPRWYETQKVVRAIGPTFLILSGMFATGTLYALFKATPAVAIGKTTALAILTVATAIVGIVCNLKKTYWNDPVFRIDQGKKAWHDAKNLSYPEIRKKYHSLINDYALLNNTDFNELVRKEAGDYINFIDRNGIEIFSILDEKNRAALRDSFINMIAPEPEYELKGPLNFLFIHKNTKIALEKLEIPHSDIEFLLLQDMESKSYSYFDANHSSLLKQPMIGGKPFILSEHAQNVLDTKFIEEMKDSPLSIDVIKEKYSVSSTLIEKLVDQRALISKEKSKDVLAEPKTASQKDSAILKEVEVEDLKTSGSYTDFRTKNGIEAINNLVVINPECKKQLASAFLKLPYPQLVSADFESDRALLWITKEMIRNTLMLDVNNLSVKEFKAKHTLAPVTEGIISNTAFYYSLEKEIESYGLEKLKEEYGDEIFALRLLPPDSPNFKKILVDYIRDHLEIIAKKSLILEKIDEFGYLPSSIRSALVTAGFKYLQILAVRNLAFTRANNDYSFDLDQAKDRRDKAFKIINDRYTLSDFEEKIKKYQTEKEKVEQKIKKQNEITASCLKLNTKIDENNIKIKTNEHTIFALLQELNEYKPEFAKVIEDDIEFLRKEFYKLNTSSGLSESKVESKRKDLLEGIEDRKIELSDHLKLPHTLKEKIKKLENENAAMEEEIYNFSEEISSMMISSVSEKEKKQMDTDLENFEGFIDHVKYQIEDNKAQKTKAITQMNDEYDQSVFKAQQAKDVQIKNAENTFQNSLSNLHEKVIQELESV